MGSDGCGSCFGATKKKCADTAAHLASNADPVFIGPTGNYLQASTYFAVIFWVSFTAGPLPVVSSASELPL